MNPAIIPYLFGKRRSPWAFFQDFTTGVLDQRISFSRASPAWYVNSAGVLVQAAANVPRFAFDPVTLQPLGLQLEVEARTNLVPVSQDLTSASVTKVLATVSGSTTSPGASAANRVQEDSTLGEHYVSREAQATTASTAHTGSVFVKADQRTRVALNFRCSTGSDTATAVFDVSTGTLVGSVVVTGGVTAGFASIRPVGNGWYRCVLTATTDTGSATSFRVKLDNGSTTFYTGDGSSGLYVWGLQLEAGSSVSSYIPTFGSAVTRAADQATVTGANFSSWFAGAPECTLFADGASNYAGPSAFLAIDNGTNDQRIELLSSRNAFTNGGALHRAGGGALEADWVPAAAFTTAPKKIAYRVKTNSSRWAINGAFDAAAVEDTSCAMPVGLDRMVIGNRSAGGIPLMGYLKALGVARYGMSDAELQSRTL